MPVRITKEVVRNKVIERWRPWEGFREMERMMDGMTKFCPAPCKNSGGENGARS